MSVREKKTFAICESEPITALGLRALLSACPNLELRMVVDSIPAAMEVVRDAPQSVLVLDQILGTQAVLDCVDWLQAASRPTAAIVLGDALAEAEVLRFVRAVAKGIVCKTADLEMLLICFRSVAAGAFWSQMEGFRILQMAFHETSASLTPREREVLKLVAQGLKTWEIGLELGIWPSTVKVHRYHIFEKTGTCSRDVPARSSLAAVGALALWTWNGQATPVDARREETRRDSELLKG